MRNKVLHLDDSVQNNREDDEVSTTNSFLSRLKNMRTTTPKVRRITEKNGLANVTYKNISKRRRKYVSDLYTTLVDSRYLTCREGNSIYQSRL